MSKKRKKANAKKRRKTSPTRRSTSPISRRSRRGSPHKRSSSKAQNNTVYYTHTNDIFTLILSAITVFIFISLVTDFGGVFGRGVRTALQIAFGMGAIFLPFMLTFWIVVAFIRAKKNVSGNVEIDPSEIIPWLYRRYGLGFILGFLSIEAMFHTFFGSPNFDSSTNRMKESAGLLGVGIFNPIESFSGKIGIIILAVTLLLIATSVVFGVSISYMLDYFKKDSSEGELARQEKISKPLARKTLSPVNNDGPEELEEDPESEIDKPILKNPQVKVNTPKKEDLTIDITSKQKVGDWQLPSLDMLEKSEAKEMNMNLIKEQGAVLEATLHEFGVDATLVGMTVGPTVTRYELELGSGVKVAKVTGLANDIAYAMASPDVRIQAPIPGMSAIGVEVPNRQRQLVSLGDILDSDAAVQEKHPLSVGLGKDIAGHEVLLNLSKMPHLLIAGATGAGKSSCINSLITSLLMRTTPDQVRLILVDPKRVELGMYNSLPHLLTEVVTNPKKAANALDWAVREMDRRYDLLASAGARDITGYNDLYDAGELPTEENPDEISGLAYARLPFIVIVVDELNDLMMVAARDVEASITRIAQMARAVGVHLVIATQRPSVDVITGVIKANVPSRLAFAVSSLQDSRVILDQPGAEKLIGQGDLLIVSANSSKAQRMQGAWVEEKSIRSIVAFWKRQTKKLDYIDGVQAEADASFMDEMAGNGAEDTDELFYQALEIIVKAKSGSTSMLQRKLRIGFARAGRLMDLLEQRGIVGPSEGSKARSVLMSEEEFDSMMAGKDSE